MSENPSPKTFYLVLPCYNEGERLSKFLPGLCTAISKSELSAKVRIVDDGSDAYHQGHYRNLMELLGPAFPLVQPTLELETNRGKGATVYSGWAEDNSSDFLAFADADGAVGPDEVVRVLKRIANDPEADNSLYAASRIHDAATQVRRRAIRNLGGLAFRWLRKQLFPFPIEDTQCGFKVIPGHFFRQHKNLLKEPGFAFDIELLYHAQKAGLLLKEIPVTWVDKKGGHMTLLNSAGLFKDLLRLKGRLGKETSG